MAPKLSISLSETILVWLNREAARAGTTPAAIVAVLLADLADPENVETDLIDQLLIDAVTWFPPLMSLDEQDEMREEFLDFLCHCLRQEYVSHHGKDMIPTEVTRFRDRLAERAAHCWRQ